MGSPFTKIRIYWIIISIHNGNKRVSGWYAEMNTSANQAFCGAEEEDMGFTGDSLINTAGWETDTKAYVEFIQTGKDPRGEDACFSGNTPAELFIQINRYQEERIFAGHGILIVKRDGKLYLRTDSAGAVSWTVELEITDDEAARAQKSERDAYEALMECERNSRFFRRID